MFNSEISKKFIEKTFAKLDTSQLGQIEGNWLCYNQIDRREYSEKDKLGDVDVLILANDLQEFEKHILRIGYS